MKSGHCSLPTRTELLMGLPQPYTKHVWRRTIVVHDTDGERIACADLSDGNKGPTLT